MVNYITQFQKQSSLEVILQIFLCHDDRVEKSKLDLFVRLVAEKISENRKITLYDVKESYILLNQYLS